LWFDLVHEREEGGVGDDGNGRHPVQHGCFGGGGSRAGAFEHVGVLRARTVEAEVDQHAVAQERKHTPGTFTVISFFVG